MTTSPCPDQSSLDEGAKVDDQVEIGAGGPSDGRGETANGHADSVGDIDQILEKWTHRQDEFAQREVQAKAEEEEFLKGFRAISRCVIRPAMEAIVQQLRKDGGDGMVSDAESEAMHRPRLILWMSLKGKIAGSPRQDLNPYLQLDLDIPHRRVDVWEGDMWDNLGVSRATAPWELKDISTEGINHRVMGILDRATSHATEF